MLVFHVGLFVDDGAVGHHRHTSLSQVLPSTAVRGTDGESYSA